MIFDDTLESLELVPAHVERAFADIAYIQAMNVAHQDLIDSVDFTAKGEVKINGKKANKEEIEKINKAFLKLMLAEKKIETILKSLSIRLEDGIKDYDIDLNKFKQSCAIAGMSLRSKELSKALDNESNEVYCTCRGSDDGKMIACDNKDCAIEWFHLRCVGLSKVPKDSWLCSSCQKSKQ